jgi:hypothetical protein
MVLCKRKELSFGEGGVSRGVQRTDKTEGELSRIPEAAAEVLAGGVHVHTRHITKREGLQLRAWPIIELVHSSLELAQRISLLGCHLLTDNLKSSLQLCLHCYHLHVHGTALRQNTGDRMKKLRKTRRKQH